MMKKQIFALCLVLAFTMACTKQEETVPAAAPAVVAPAEQEVELAEQSEQEVELAAQSEQEVELAAQSEPNAEEEEESEEEASEQK